MKNIITWRNYLGFYILILFLINLTLLNLPLTNVFGYEFSVINSLLIILLTGIYTIHFFKVNFSVQDRSFTSELYKSAIFFLIIPFLVSVSNSFFKGFCSFMDGLQFYIVITAPSIIIGVALGLITVMLTNRFYVILFFLLYIGILMIIAYEIYFNPQVYVYNPIIGFFPGTIYDEGISVTGNLILYRFLNVLFFSWVISAILRLKRNKKSNVIFLTFKMLLITAIFFFFSPNLGFSTTFKSITDRLSITVETNHFVIHCDKRIDVEKIKAIAINHEYYYQELEDYFDVKLDKKIHSFIFYDNDQKKELFGSRNADVAKPWLYQIYMSYENWEHTLKHELAHCFSAKFGTGFLKLASGLNPLLIEGVAEAADGNYDDNSIHFMAALAYKSDYRVDLENLLTTIGFFTKTSSISYIFGGSFVKFLIDNYGIDLFKKYYLTGDIKMNYGINLSDIINKYYSFLNNLKYSYSEDQADFYFGRKSLFQKVCPRAISEQLREGWEQFREFEYTGAKLSFYSILSKANNYSALIGLVRTYEKTDSLLEAVNLLKNKIESYESTSYYYNLELELADLFVKLNNVKSADSLYRVLIRQNPNRRLSYLANLRNALVRASLIKMYLTGSNYDKTYVLQKLNGRSYNYWSVPVMINLSRLVDESYEVFLQKFNKNFVVDNYPGSYAAFVSSKYMLVNNDFVNANNMARRSLRYISDKNFKNILDEQYRKTRWFLKNGELFLKNIKIIK